MSTATPPPVWPLLPLKKSVLFPQLLMPLTIGRTSSVAAIDAALAREDKALVVVAQRDPDSEAPSAAELFAVGTQALLKKVDRSEDVVQVLVQGVARVRLDEVVSDRGALQARAVLLPEPGGEGTEVEALHRTILDQAARVQAIAQPDSPVGITQILAQAPDPLHQCYLLAAMLNLSFDKSQQLLECDTRLAALRLTHDFLAHEIQVLELRQKIASSAQNEISREQREYLLRQQLRAIEDELGVDDPQESELKLLRKRVEEAELPEAVRREADRELSRLARMPSAAADYQVSRSYLELILELPWTKLSADELDLPRVRAVLDDDHFDLEEVKKRIVEHLAVLKLNPKAKAPILCFVGPPGVGKTSLGQSIARAMGRKFERMSLGGMHDEAELRGHRRTYVGSMPGRILQAIRRAGVRNPVLMLDEVDKLGRDFRGDPAAALLEILDPAQNFEFRDNYLDLPFDLSKVFFITTANTLDTVPQPLLDRMEVLRLSGYTDEEKHQIARRYLIPRQLGETGLGDSQVQLSDETLQRVIRRYTREAGLRQLERYLGRLCRQAAVRFAEGSDGRFAPSPDDLAELLGPERFFQEEARRDLPPGVAAGLAWTESGGDVLYVEALLLPEGKGLTMTGQLGDVMKESAQAAQAYVLAQAGELAIDSDVFKHTGVHLHVPAGAVPKDGPSAGVTMATAFASLYTRLKARSDTAMTGEITLSGLVLPVGGIKEKLLAARRAGFRRVILPRANSRDLPEVPQETRDSLEIILADRIEDVLAAAVPGLAGRLAALATV